MGRLGAGVISPFGGHERLDEHQVAGAAFWYAVNGMCQRARVRGWIQDTAKAGDDEALKLAKEMRSQARGRHSLQQLGRHIIDTHRSLRTAYLTETKKIQFASSLPSSANALAPFFLHLHHASKDGLTRLQPNKLLIRDRELVKRVRQRGRPVSKHSLAYDIRFFLCSLRGKTHEHD